MKSITFITLLTISSACFGQGFIQPLDSDDSGFLLNKEATATLKSGETITGKLKNATLISGYLKKARILTEEGTKVDLLAEEVDMLKVKAGDFARMAMISESTESIKKMSKADFDEIKTREYIVFVSALMDKKKDKPRFMQLLNPGFDSQIRVFADPNANETGTLSMGGLAITGGEARSYLFLMDGEKVVKVKKNSYRKDFEELFSSCPEMMETFAGDKIMWDDVAGHVYAYDQACGEE